MSNDHNTLAICLVLHNEEKNVGRLLKSCEMAFVSKKNCEFFIYLDAANPETQEIVNSFKQNSKKKVNVENVPEWKGKKAGVNHILKGTTTKDIVIFLDGDIATDETSLQSLYSQLVSKDALVTYPEYRIIAPRDNETLFTRSVVSVLSKVTSHKNRKTNNNYFSGRMFCAYRRALSEIPDELIADDFYLNLQVPEDKILYCKDAYALYRLPTTTEDIFRYAYRIGTHLRNIRDFNADPNLWKKQKTRVNLLDYFLLGLTGQKFHLFLAQLNPLEYFVYIYTRLVTFAGKCAGFIVSARNKANWKPLESTKGVRLD